MKILEKKKKKKQIKQLLNKANKIYLSRDINNKKEYDKLTVEANKLRDEADKLDIEINLG